ncbi:polysaccharide deacetylase [Burkholderia sp. JPY481]
MIGVLHSCASKEAGEYVLAALRRSVSSTGARAISPGMLRDLGATIVTAVDVPDAWGDALVQWLGKPRNKLIVFGRLPLSLASELGCQERPWPDGFQQAARSPSAPSRETAQSRAVVRYTKRASQLGGRAWLRPFERFDFTDEWNNLGFGAIRADGSIWATSAPIDAPQDCRLASVDIDDERGFTYAALWERDAASVLWFNRPVGPIDSFEWRLVENFVSSHRSDRTACQPVLTEIPWGHDAAITSRLDCDEDVESARPLWNAYRRLGVPFSLAVHTSNLGNEANHRILRELAADPLAAILSHTATHAPNWGGSLEAALVEGSESMRLIEEVIRKPVRYAVSPFHQSPPYALAALSDAGYAGCIGGIIRNDPEFLIARGGGLAGLPAGFIGHSQQTMLHGDCMLASGDPLAVFKQAFDLAFDSHTLFGYLDHPFSERYQYGWPDEDARIEAHQQFIAYMQARARKPLFMHEDDAMDFLRAKSLANVIADDGAWRVQLSAAAPTPYGMTLEWQGESVQALNGTRLT